MNFLTLVWASVNFAVFVRFVRPEMLDRLAQLLVLPETGL